MLCRALKYLLDSKDPHISDWFFQFAGDLTGVSVSNEEFHFTVVDASGGVTNTSLSEFNIISKLETDEQVAEATLAAWSLCKFLDRTDETDTMLREFVKSETDVTLEPVPFTIEKGNLATICEEKFCKGTPKSAENVSLSIDNNRLLVILPSTNTALRQLFFKRLRRISA